MTDDVTTPTQMEVKSNYTRSRSERIPEHWKIKPLGELIRKIEGGGTPSKEVDAYWNGRIPWASVKDLSDFNSKKTKDFISHEGLKNSSSKLIPKGTVITSTRMAVGTAVIFDIDVAINQDLKAIFPTEELDPKFLLYYFIKHQKRILYLGTGSTVKGIQLNDLKKIQIILPPIEEQKKIVDCLSNSVVTIKNLNRIIEKKELRKKGLMQQLLSGNKRLPGYGEEWTEKRVRDIAHEVSIKNANDEDVEVLSCTKYHGLVPSLKYFGRKVYSDDTSNYKVVPNRHFAYATNHIEEGSIGYQSELSKGLVSPMYTVFKTVEAIDDQFCTAF